MYYSLAQHSLTHIHLLYHSRITLHNNNNSAPAAAGGGWARVALGVAGGWLVGGKVHAGRLQKKLNAKHKEDQKVLYQQYYNDVYALQQQNAELLQALEQYAAAAGHGGGGARRAA